jgi:hypothetical protein
MDTPTIVNPLLLLEQLLTPTIDDRWQSPGSVTLHPEADPLGDTTRSRMAPDAMYTGSWSGGFADDDCP